MGLKAPQGIFKSGSHRLRGAAMELKLKRSVNELQAIVAATERFFADNGIDASIRTPIDLSIEELFVNMVTYNLGTDHDILLRLQLVDGSLQVSLVDYDVEPFDPTFPPEVDIDAPLAERDPKGLGLYLVSKMVDSIHYEYRNRESKVTFIKKMDGAHD